jgi:hypothetical protein
MTLSTLRPCSFDYLKDDLGAPRSTFPHSCFMVAGTQATSAKQNYVAFLRLANLGQGRCVCVCVFVCASAFLKALLNYPLMCLNCGITAILSACTYNHVHALAQA